MKAERPRLHALAEALGIAPSYWDIAGRLRPTSDPTREALVAAMGFDGSDEGAAERSWAALRRATVERLVEPVVVWREYGGAVPAVELRAPAAAASLDWELELHLEDGRRERATGRLEPGAPRPASLALPVYPPPGHHDLVVRVAGPGVAPREADQRFVMAPRSGWTVGEQIGDARVFGIWANLYTIRSGHGFGFGDFGD
jgi:hypothetical protein